MNKKQYTIRQIPDNLDIALRSKARLLGKSLNKVLLESLAQGLGVHEESAKYHDLDYLAGSWKDDPAFEEALKDFEKIDEDSWK